MSPLRWRWGGRRALSLTTGGRGDSQQPDRLRILQSIYPMAKSRLSASSRERFSRWVRVEALCLCATAERMFGRIDETALRSFDHVPAVIDEAVRLASSRQGSGLAGVFSRFHPRDRRFWLWPAMAGCALLGHGLHQRR